MKTEKSEKAFDFVKREIRDLCCGDLSLIPHFTQGLIEIESWAVSEYDLTDSEIRYVDQKIRRLAI